MGEFSRTKWLLLIHCNRLFSYQRRNYNCSLLAVLSDAPLLDVDVNHAVDRWRHLPRGRRVLAALDVVVPDEVGGTRPVAVEDLPVAARDVHVAAVARLVVSFGLPGAVADATLIHQTTVEQHRFDDGTSPTTQGNTRFCYLRIIKASQNSQEDDIYIVDFY